ncbi:MAG: anthranilate phosphoribosyltransferase [Deltaproteobacteria bacterium]
MNADEVLRAGLAHLADGVRLDADATAGCIDAMMGGEASPLLIAALLSGMRVAGESTEQIVGAARAMRQHSHKVVTSRAPLVDTCGTGGDGKSTFSISTAAALVAAGAGASVAKHGNRAASGTFGGADTLEAMGVAIELPAAAAGRCLDEVGMAFLFARTLHPAMRHVGPIRGALKIRTIFNLLGPLTNPAGVRRQVVGVPSHAALDLVARALLELGSEHALVVHSHDGLDEISLAAGNDIIEVRDGSLHRSVLTAKDLGLSRVSADDLYAETLADSVAAVQDVLAGKAGPQAAIVAANAGAALYVAGIADSLRAGVKAAKKSMTSGAAAAVLARLVEVSQAEAASLRAS